MRLVGDMALATTYRHARRIVASLALLSVVLLAACAQSGRVTANKTATATTTSGANNQTPVATASANPAITLTNSPFVCANPAGSSLTYAFVNADRQIYTVTGCSTPVQLTRLQRADPYSMPTPVAWSPSRRFLAIHPNLQQDYCLKIVDTSTGAMLNSRYDCFNGDPAQTGDVRTFIGWLDDNTFLGRIDVGVAYAPDPVRIVRVDIHSQAETLVASFAWMSDQKLRGNYLFFGGRVNPNDTNASLYRLSLADGNSVKLAPLGLSGTGGCQVGPGPCSWTAPWDVSADGAHLLFHNPGADSFPSDTHSPSNTPIYYANVDGSGAVEVLAGQPSQALLAPVFDPSGERAAVFVSSGNNSVDFIYQVLPGGAIQRVVGDYEITWRADDQAIVDTKTTYSGDQTNSTVTLIMLASGARTPLAPNTYFYLWAQ